MTDESLRIAHLREEYALSSLDESTVDRGPVRQFLAWFGDVGVVYATIVMTVVVVVFCEVLPKTAAFNDPIRFALLVAGPMRIVVRVLADQHPAAFDSHGRDTSGLVRVQYVF